MSDDLSQNWKNHPSNTHYAFSFFEQFSFFSPFTTSSFYINRVFPSILSFFPIHSLSCVRYALFCLDTREREKYKRLYNGVASINDCRTPDIHQNVSLLNTFYITGAKENTVCLRTDAPRSSCGIFVRIQSTFLFSPLLPSTQNQQPNRQTTARTECSLKRASHHDYFFLLVCIQHRRQPSSCVFALLIVAVVRWVFWLTWFTCFGWVGPWQLYTQITLRLNLIITD